MFSREFGVQLKWQRVEAGFKQKEVAALCGIPTMRWSHLELGVRFPNNDEVRRIGKVLKLGRVFVPPSKALQRLKGVGSRAFPLPAPFFSPQDRDSHVRFRSARRNYSNLVSRLEKYLRARPEFDDFEYFFHNIRLDSGLEALHLLVMACEGAVPAFKVPLSLGHLPHPVVDSASMKEVGHCLHLALLWKGSLWFPQIAFKCSDVVRVDLLVRDSTGWKVTEINGPGHRSDGDLRRFAQVALPTRWMTEADVVAGAKRFLADLDSRRGRPDLH